MIHFFIFLVLLPSTLAEGYIIERQVELIQGSWIDQPDTFMLPSAMCSGDISISNCTAMGGTRIMNRCGCSCNKINELMEFYKSTFGFYDNEWKCFENSKVRTHSGCPTIMNLREETIPLMTLPMVKPKVGHNVPGLTNCTNCAIIGGKYLECDGKWHQLNITLVRSRFYLDENEYLYYSTSEPPTPTINGRVIRLKVECTQPKKTQCVLFKVKGQLKCPVIPPTPSSIIWTTTTTYDNSTETQEVTTTPTIFPRMTDQFHKTGERTGSHDDNSGMIAGAFAGVIGLVIIVIGIIVVVMRRRKKRYHIPSRSGFVENESYGLGVDATLRFVVPGQLSQDENECSYTTDLNREIQSAVSQRLHDNEDREYAVPYGTGTIPQVNSEIPIYDALNEPKNPNTDNSKKEIQSVPPYETFVIEEREAHENEFDEPPEYQVPQEPFSEGATVYAFPDGRGSNRVSPHTSLDGPIPRERDDDYTYYSVGDVITDH